jgi:hypothetical protein
VEPHFTGTADAGTLKDLVTTSWTFYPSWGVTVLELEPECRVYCVRLVQNSGKTNSKA